MESYLTKRKSTGSKSLLSKVIKEDKNKEELPDKYKIDPKTGKSLDGRYGSQKLTQKDNYPTFGEKEAGEDYEGMEDDYEQKPGFFARIIKVFSVPASESEDIDTIPQDNSPSDTEIKEVLRITVKWLKLLPPEDIDDIKNSEDFRTYKELLKKYNLIK